MHVNFERNAQGSSSHVSFIESQRKKKKHATGLLSRGGISARGSSTSRYSNDLTESNRSFLFRGRGQARRDFSSRSIEEARKGGRFSTRSTVAKFSRR